MTKGWAIAVCLGLLVGPAFGCAGEEEFPEPEPAEASLDAGTSPAAAARARRRGVTTFKPDPKELGVPPTPPGATRKHPHLARNMKFDALRTRGITQVHERKTKQALETFSQALKVRPNDPSIKLWVEAIRESIKLQKESTKQAAGQDFRELMELLRTKYAFPDAPKAATTGAGAALSGLAPAADGLTVDRSKLPPPSPLPSLNPNLVN